MIIQIEIGFRLIEINIVVLSMETEIAFDDQCGTVLLMLFSEPFLKTHSPWQRNNLSFLFPSRSRSR